MAKKQKIKQLSGVFHIYSEDQPSFKQFGGFSVRLKVGDIWHSPDGSVFFWDGKDWQLNTVDKPKINEEVS